ncbi:MAG: hypothetical protein RLZZ450_7037 [Pseudomonadota bacterium]
MQIRLPQVLASVLLLAACSSTPVPRRDDGGSTNDPAEGDDDGTDSDAVARTDAGPGQSSSDGATRPTTRLDGSASPTPGADGGSGPDTTKPTGPIGPGPSGFYSVERLDRGLVAVQIAGGVYVGFRLFADEYDPAATQPAAFTLLRDGVEITKLSGATNYVDPMGSAKSRYAVRTAAGATSAEVTPLAQPYLRVPIEPPAGGKTDGSPTCETANEAYTYSANDASAADLDGDGAYELILKWDPSNSKDNSQSGCTGNVYLDAYKIDGTRLWRIDLGPNIRAGAHYTQFMVYDFDGDGLAELAVKTAPGTRDATDTFLGKGPAESDDDSKVYRSLSNASGRTGYILTGPEYLTVFDGKTGRERDTVDFDQARGSVKDWGDDYGNRVDRFLAAVAYLDDTGLPSVVMARGYYTRTTLVAYNFRAGKLTQLWKFDSNQSARDAKNKPFSGQGAHAMSVANVDADRGQELIYGAMVVDHDGKGRCSTGYGHGDALHVSDLVTTRPGLEVFMPHEDGAQPSYDMHDASTCETLVLGPVNGNDTGRGVAADLSASPGAELWSAGGPGLLSSAGERVGSMPSSTNFLAYWDGDDYRELVDKTSVSKYGAGELVRCAECAANNTTKSNPALVADLLGDYREEVIWRETDSRALRIYTTTIPTQRRLFTLMHDPQYRVAIAWQNTAYNQPPHPSFALVADGAPPARPDVHYAR